MSDGVVYFTSTCSETSLVYKAFSINADYVQFELKLSVSEEEQGGVDADVACSTSFLPPDPVVPSKRSATPRSSLDSLPRLKLGLGLGLIAVNLSASVLVP